MQDDDDVLTRKRKADSLVEDKKAEENVDQITEKDILTFVPTKSTAEGVWQPVLGLVQVRKLRGNFWKKCGFTVNGVDFLYPEEALTLYERKSIAVYFQDGPMMDKRQFFDACLKVIPISVYLVYAKLRVSDVESSDSDSTNYDRVCLGTGLHCQQA